MAGGLVKHFKGREGEVKAMRGGDQLGRADLLPAALPHAQLRAARPAHGPDGGRRHPQPVTYLMEALRSLILDDLDWDKILPGFGVVLRSAW